jgi:hypothetical protein
MRKFYFVVIFLVFKMLATAQIGGGPLACTANAGVVPLVRASGMSELTGNIVLSCTGGTPTAAGQPVPGVNIQVYLNTNVTSRLLSDGGVDWTEALLLIDEPVPGSQLVCGAPDAPETSPGVCTISGTGDGTGVYSGAAGRPNVFQGVRIGDNVIEFTGVPFDPPDVAGRIMRIVNIRANASQLGVNPLGVPTPIQAFVTVSAASPIPVNNPVQVVGFTMPELRFLVETPPVFQQSAPQNPELARNSRKSGTAQFSVRVQENFGTVFLKRTGAAYVDADTSPAPASQNMPGNVYNSETGFFNPSFPTITDRGNLGMAGLADSGTRIMVKFSDVPPGVDLFTDAVVNLPPGPIAAGVLRRIDSDSGAFAPSAGNAYGIVPVPVDPATWEGFAVYEVLEASPFMVEAADIPVYVAYLSNGKKKAAGTGTANVSVYLAPESTAGQASLTEPLPRFANFSTPVTAFTIAP